MRFLKWLVSNHVIIVFNNYFNTNILKINNKLSIYLVNILLIASSFLNILNIYIIVYIKTNIL